jgi:heme exporter protein C
VALLYGCIGIVTGMIWARFTWDTFWTKDPQLNGAAITILAYLAYMVLRASIPDARKRAEISAVYGIFAFVLMVVLIVVLPRMQDVDSLHPGKGGNPGFGNYKDLKNDMRLVFYPAILAWTLVGFWLANLSFRIQHLTRISHAQS